MDQQVKEHEIRPENLFQIYLELSRQDIQSHFSDVPREPLTCPACNLKGEFAFEKLGFEYLECPDCLSLWVSPRPTFESFTAFYSNSVSSRYWAEVFYPAVEAVRREKLWKPKAQKVAQIAHEFAVDAKNVIDIGGGSGTFAAEFEAISEIPVTVIDPSPESASICRERGMEVIEAFLEEVDFDKLPKGQSVFTSFELFEHVHNPRGWFQSVADLMQSGDIFIVTTLSSLGLDIRTLWEKSDSVSPPHHINFLNPSALSQLGTHVGLEPVRVFTPGVLDMDIMMNSREKISDRFWSSVLDTSDALELAEWQHLIIENGRSSHMWAVFQKP